METKAYKLKFSDLFAMGLGFTIGGAVFSLTGIAIGMTGTSVFLVYIVGAVTILISMLPTIIAASSVPRTSVSYILSKEAFGRYGGGVYFWLFFIGRIAMAMNCTAFAIYLTSVFTTLNPRIVGMAVCIFFFITNYFGMKAAVKLQKIMNLVLYTALVLFIVLGVFKVDFNMVFSKENFLTGGAKGFVSAVSLVIFSLGGGMSVLEFGGMTENPKRNLPKVCFAVAGAVALLFSGMALVGAGVAPLSQTAYKPLAFAAGIVLNRPMFLFFVLGGCCLAITTTINAAYNWYSTTCLQAIDDGWFPRFFGARNKYGSPVRLQVIWLLFGLIPIIAGIDNAVVTRVSTGLQILANVIPNFGLLMMPKLYSEDWKNSPFHTKTMGGVYMLTFVPTILTLILVYFNFMTYPPVVLYCVLCSIALGIVYVAFMGRRIAGNQPTPAQKKSV
jgi:APA family basic amino acid/polyamine antiporter